MRGWEAGAASAHHGPFAVVGGLEPAFPDGPDGLADGGAHVPERGGHDDIPAVLFAVHVVDVAEGDDSAFPRRLDDACAFGIKHIDPGPDLRQGGLLRLRRVVPGVDEGHLETDLGVGPPGAGHEGVEEAVDLADGIAADHADAVRLRHRPGEHAHQVARFVDIVVEDGVVRAVRPRRVAHQERDLGMVVGYRASLRPDVECLAHDKIDAAPGKVAKDPNIVGVRDLLREGIVDLAAPPGIDERLMQPRDPLLLHWLGIDGRNFYPIGCRAADAEQSRYHRRKQSRMGLHVAFPRNGLLAVCRT